ncbi:MAG: response regulator [Deltaproteobacteria bacterium]|nr:response regulator [Deltaproteobacteria bacterium]
MKEGFTKVLLIEDDPDDAFSIQESFNEVRAGSIHFQVQCAKKLKEGLKILKSEPIDVVILDLLLPEVEGFDAVLRVRDVSPSVPVVVLTCVDDEYVALESLSHGAQDYLVKGSIDAGLLVRSIRYAIERGHLLSRLEQSSEDRFFKIIDKNADAMAVIDKDGIVRFVNPAYQFLFEQHPEDIVGKPFPMTLTTNPLAKLEIILKNGDTKNVQMRVSQIEWEKKPAQLASIRDVTALQKLENLKREMSEREEMDRIKDEFVSTVSHELRTPLTTIKSAIENLKDGISGDLNEKQSRVVEIADRNADRLVRIINDLLEISRLESGVAKIHKRRVDAVPLLQEVLQNFQMRTKKHHFILEGNFAKNLPPIYADADMIVQVMNNLLDNALRFAKTKISVEAKATGQDVEVIISDDGIGIPEDRAKELFGKFVQFNRPMGGEGYKGTGLGLAICKEIVDRHGGRIWASSQTGKGTQFHFTMRQFQEETDTL